MFSFVFLRGRCVLWYFEPFKPDPCLAVVCVFFFGGFVDAVFSLLFSFSQVLGKPKPPSGFSGSPCVSSSWTSSPTSIRAPCPSPSSRSRPAPVFSSCIFVAIARFLVRVFAQFWSWCCLVSSGVGLGQSVFRLFVVVGNGLACASVLCFALPVCVGSRATPVDRPQWRPTCHCGLRRPGLPVSCWESTLGRSDLIHGGWGGRAPLSAGAKHDFRKVTLGVSPTGPAKSLIFLF